MPATKSAGTASTAAPWSAMKIPVWPVATNAERTPRLESSAWISSAVVILPTLQSLPTVRTISASLEAARRAAIERTAGGRRTSWIVQPLARARAASSGSSARNTCRPESTSQPRSSASATTRRHGSGSAPPWGAIPSSSVSGSCAAAASRPATTGMSPPTPTQSSQERPARTESMTATTSAGR